MTQPEEMLAEKLGIFSQDYLQALKRGVWDETVSNSLKPFPTLSGILEFGPLLCEKPSREQLFDVFMMLPAGLVGMGLIHGFNGMALREALNSFVEAREELLYYKFNAERIWDSYDELCCRAEAEMIPGKPLEGELEQQMARYTRHLQYLPERGSYDVLPNGTTRVRPVRTQESRTEVAVSPEQYRRDLRCLLWKRECEREHPFHVLREIVNELIMPTETEVSMEQVEELYVNLPLHLLGCGATWGFNTQVFAYSFDSYLKDHVEEFRAKFSHSRTILLN